MEANAEVLNEGGGMNGWRSINFEFVRRIRGHPELVDLDAEAAADLVEDILWETEALPFSGEYPDDGIWYEAFGSLDTHYGEDDPEQAFLSLWDKVDPSRDLDTAVHSARLAEAQAPTDFFGEDLAGPRRQGFRVFLFLCRELVDYYDGGVFPIAVEPMAKALGSNRRVIGRWRTEAVKRGFLRQVAADVPKKTAATFSWVFTD